MDTIDSKNQISLSEKKLIMLEMMDEIDYFCSKHNLTYFLIGGTLLGAIRHNGYIPWDDDIDIGLPRNDYNKLIKTFASLSGNIEIIKADNFHRYRWPNAKAIHTKTKLVELDNEKTAIGVFIDIFPIDGICGNYKYIKKKVIQKTFWQNLLALKYLKIDRHRSKMKNFVVIVCKTLKIIPDKWLIKMINSTEKKSVPFSDCEYICNFCGAWGIREITKASNFLQTIDANFEGRIYKIPIGYDDYLRTVYGNYMELPPAEKRVTHHQSKSYWRKQ